MGISLYKYNCPWVSVHNKTFPNQDISILDSRTFNLGSFPIVGSSLRKALLMLAVDTSLRDSLNKQLMVPSAKATIIYEGGGTVDVMLNLLVVMQVIWLPALKCDWCCHNTVFNGSGWLGSLAWNNLCMGNDFSLSSHISTRLPDSPFAATTSESVSSRTTNFKAITLRPVFDWIKKQTFQLNFL